MKKTYLFIYILLASILAGRVVHSLRIHAEVLEHSHAVHTLKNTKTELQQQRQSLEFARSQELSLYALSQKQELTSYVPISQTKLIHYETPVAVASQD